jgi:FdhD protein
MVGQAALDRDDRLAVEEPLEIRVGRDGVYRSLAVTMRTPGSDEELATGFLFTEAVIQGLDELADVHPWAERPNVLLADLRPGRDIDWKRFERHFYAASSCGICGKASIERIEQAAKPVVSALRVPPALLSQLPDRIRGAQPIFDSTGGVHAAAWFDARGELLACREDVGRHNALDKLVGWGLRAGAEFSQAILFVSGRAGFEIVQKAAMAGIPVIAAVGAPSSLAVQLADSLGITLAGFLREDRFNLYTSPERVTSA